MLKLTAAAVLGAWMASTAAASALDDLRWSKRVLLVFAAPDDPRLAEQTAFLSAVPTGEIAARDVVVLLVPPEGETTTLFGEPRGSRGVAAIRKAYDASAKKPFEALLIGKDGGVKWRESRPAAASEIFGLIDSMPMRRQELNGNDGRP
ncbi:hypothetical protein ASG43_05405 [Aureimonas sp. Leaf454]|uniref:DUF4174 domain-containing protein n=1 Tax=Aureimonas sp. Leaf454 TaxID=1736381 RepID=UPI0006F8FAA5|nr:DUF4174 domain-containing protein [Aureimonas sp. Leaf454]KQT50718.1 hypothetical protein ASG43_05405 [Aureimonas sp. Leaf454]